MHPPTWSSCKVQKLLVFVILHISWCSTLTILLYDVDFHGACYHFNLHCPNTPWRWTSLHVNCHLEGPFVWNVFPIFLPIHIAETVLGWLFKNFTYSGKYTFVGLTFHLVGALGELALCQLPARLGGLSQPHHSPNWWDQPCSTALRIQAKATTFLPYLRAHLGFTNQVEPLPALTFCGKTLWISCAPPPRPPNSCPRSSPNVGI